MRNARALRFDAGGLAFYLELHQSSPQCNQFLGPGAREANCVNTEGFNKGSPFCKTKTTIENKGMSVRNEKPMQMAVQKLFPRILCLE